MIYCVFTGLGKTYFCQHNLHWYDLDENFFNAVNNSNMMLDFIKKYDNSNYNLVVGCRLSTIKLLQQHLFSITVVLPDTTVEMHEEVISRIAGRPGDEQYAEEVDEVYDEWLNSILGILRPQDKIKYVMRGQYLSDVI